MTGGRGDPWLQPCVCFASQGRWRVRGERQGAWACCAVEQCLVFVWRVVKCVVYEYLTVRGELRDGVALVADAPGRGWWTGGVCGAWFGYAVLPGDRA